MTFEMRKRKVKSIKAHNEKKRNGEQGGREIERREQ
jgi:hypothetical protein